MYGWSQDKMITANCVITDWNGKEMTRPKRSLCDCGPCPHCSHLCPFISFIHSQHLLIHLHSFSQVCLGIKLFVKTFCVVFLKYSLCRCHQTSYLSDRLCFSAFASSRFTYYGSGLRSSYKTLAVREAVSVLLILMLSCCASRKHPHYSTAAWNISFLLCHMVCTFSVS